MMVKHGSPYFTPSAVERVAIEHMCKRNWPKATKILDKVIAKDPDRVVALQAYWLAAKGPFELFTDRHIGALEACVKRYVAAKKRGERWGLDAEASKAAYAAETVRRSAAG